MSCEFNAGRDGKIQLGIASTWGTKAAATIRIPLDTESLSYTPNYGEADAKIGNTLASRVEILSEHIEGDLETFFTVDEIPLFLYAALGKEFTTIDGQETDTYKHYFVPVKSGGSSCLPILSAEVDRIKEVMEYDSLKISSISLSADKEDYVKLSVSLVGRQETDAGTLTTGLNLSSRQYFKFKGAKVYADDVEMEDVSSISWDYDNNLPSDRYTTSSAGLLTEMNPQGRSSSLSLTVYLSDAINTMRKDIFKTGATMSVELIFQTTDKLADGTGEADDVYAEFGILLDNCYLTEVPLNIDSPDELALDLSFMIADHDDVDFVGDGTGLEDQTITTEDTISTGDTVRVTDEDGFARVFKYIGEDDVVPSTDTITFQDTITSEGDAPSIFLAGPLFNDAYWEMAEGVVAYVIDDNSDEQV